MGVAQSSIMKLTGTVAGAAAAVNKIHTDLQKAKLARDTVSGKKEAIKQNREASKSRLLAIQGFKMKGGEK